MKEQLSAIKAAAEARLKEAADLAELEQLRIKFLGKKGELTAAMKEMGKLSKEERPAMGKLANEVRSFVENALSEKAEALKKEAAAAKLKIETLDVTVPGKRPVYGKKTPADDRPRRP